MQKKPDASHHPDGVPAFGASLNRNKPYKAAWIEQAFHTGQETKNMLKSYVTFDPFMPIDPESFPLDLLLTSRVYGWITLLSLRSSYQNKLRSQLYPSTIGNLPWSENLAAVEADLEALRDPFLNACRARFEAARELDRQAAALALVPRKAAFKAHAAKTDKLVPSAAFDDGEPILVALQDDESSDPLTVTLSEDGHAVPMPNALLVARLRLGLALAQAKGMEITKGNLPTLFVPEDDATETALVDLLARFDPIAVESEVQACVDEIDRVVGPALGLTPGGIDFIQTDMRDDPFLSRVRPAIRISLLHSAGGGPRWKVALDTNETDGYSDE